VRKTKIEINTMISITNSSPSNNIRSRTVTARSRSMGDLATPTITPIRNHPHDISLVSFAHNFVSRTSKRRESYQKFSASLLKNKSLLVPTRLALKRQQAALKSPTLLYEPIRSDTFQIELGNPSDITTQNDQQYTKAISSEHNQIKSTSNYNSGQVKEDIPYTLPTDILLMYR
jgi:hypothetical protein